MPTPEPVNPILLDFPDQFETERLIIRAPRAGDGPALNEAVVESLDHLRPWMPWAKQAPTVEASEEMLRRGVARWAAREDLWMMLIRKADGRWLGGSGLHRMIWDVPQFEIGYWVRASEEGKGYVTEAVCGITAFAFDRLAAERVMIQCDALNTRSAAVAERCGYTFEGRLRRNDRAVTGELRDTLVYSVIRPEWLARADSSDAAP